MRRPSFSTKLLITSILFTGLFLTIAAVSLTETFAYSDKIERKQIQQKDDDNKKDYQMMYKQYDFEKYLNYHYTYIPEYNDNLDSKSGDDDDLSEKNPFAATAIYNNFKENEDNKKKHHKQQSTNRDKDEAKYILELGDRKDFDNDKKYSSDINDKKKYKNIKIIECRNFNINAYDVEDLKSIETLLTKPTTGENDYDGDYHQEKSHNEKNSRETKEYDINSNTKVIFICNNEHHDLRPTTTSNNFPTPLTSEGIILPTHSQSKYNNNNNNNNGEDKTATTISYSQYKKSLSNDRN
jgi:hypothetical protein